MEKPFVNLAEIAFTRALQHEDRFEAKLAPVASLLGARKLGYNVTQVPPGKRAFPFHDHHANEEMFLVLEGEGTLRYGEDTWRIRAGDCIACPAGGPAHQIINTGTVNLRYLAVSTMIDTDISQYPDSGKFGAVGGRVPGGRPGDATFAGFFDESKRLDYWDGE